MVNAKKPQNSFRPCKGLPLDQVKAEDFDEDGIINQSIRFYVEKTISTEDYLSVDKSVQNRIMNALFTEIVNLVDYETYKKKVFHVTRINSVMQKSLFLYAVRSLLVSLRMEQDPKLICNLYVDIFVKMMDYNFSTRTDYDKEELLEAFGSFGTIYADEVEKAVLTYQINKVGNVYVEKLTFVNNVVERVLLSNCHELPVYNECLNAFRVLVYFSENVLRLKDENVTYVRKQHMLNGFDVNMERIWLYPDLLLNFDSLGMNMIDLAKFIEENENLKLDLEKVGEPAWESFHNESVTGISFFRLFANGTLKFAMRDIHTYIVEVDEVIKNNFTGYEYFITEFVKTLRDYNKLDVDNWNLEFGSVAGVNESEIKYGVHPNVLVHSRSRYEATVVEEEEKEEVNQDEPGRASDKEEKEKAGRGKSKLYQISTPFHEMQSVYSPLYYYSQDMENAMGFLAKDLGIDLEKLKKESVRFQFGQGKRIYYDTLSIKIPDGYTYYTDEEEQDVIVMEESSHGNQAMSPMYMMINCVTPVKKITKEEFSANVKSTGKSWGAKYEEYEFGDLSASVLWMKAAVGGGMINNVAIFSSERLVQLRITFHKGFSNMEETTLRIAESVEIGDFSKYLDANPNKEKVEERRRVKLKKEEERIRFLKETVDNAGESVTETDEPTYPLTTPATPTQAESTEKDEEKEGRSDELVFNIADLLDENEWETELPETLAKEEETIDKEDLTPTNGSLLASEWRLDNVIGENHLETLIEPLDAIKFSGEDFNQKPETDLDGKTEPDFKLEPIQLEPVTEPKPEPEPVLQAKWDMEPMQTERDAKQEPRTEGESEPSEKPKIVKPPVVQEEKQMETSEKTIVNIKELEAYAGRCYKNRKYDDAFLLYHEIHKRMPNDWISLFRMGMCKAWQTEFLNYNLKDMVKHYRQSKQLLEDVGTDYEVGNKKMMNEMLDYLMDFESKVRNEFKDIRSEAGVYNKYQSNPSEADASVDMEALRKHIGDFARITMNIVYTISDLVYLQGSDKDKSVMEIYIKKALSIGNHFCDEIVKLVYQNKEDFEGKVFKNNDLIQVKRIKEEFKNEEKTLSSSADGVKEQRKRYEDELKNLTAQLKLLEGQRFKAKQKKEVMAKIEYVNRELSKLKP